MGAWFINYSQLIPFGITEKHVDILVGFLGILLCYYLLYPVIKLVILLNLNRVLTYFTCSFLLLFIVGLVNFRGSIGNTEEATSTTIANVALGIILFGGLLFLIQVTHTIIAQIKAHNSKSI
ncbi:hypothetical protein [Aquibacillus saliphilus]|uniref:hypothetical protein n=1 Tax=Aquibacillus saliphilus TaxID=1909422 RepID=UPI001CF00FF7|nr:hypothetical protein [Aquibacillus saliphilus]